MNKKITLTSAIALALAAIPLSSIAACPDKGQGGKLTYLGGDITIEEEVASAGYTSELGLYVSSPGTRVNLSSVTPTGTQFIMFNWNRNQTVLGQPFPYTVTFDPGDFGIAPGPIDLGIYVRNTGFTYYMGDGTANPDAIAHTLITDLNDGTFRVGFEDLFNGGDCDFNDNQFRFSGGISGEELNKVLTSGPDVDGDGAIDLVVTVGAPAPVTYDFTIVYTGDERVLIWDTVPAEWSTVTLDASTGLAIGQQVGNGPARRAATRVTWDVAEIGTLLATAETRPSPGGNGKFAPTACGLLSLNDGAVAYKVDPITGELILDETGQPIVVFGPTDGIHLIAVGDEDVGFLPANYPRDGTGDFDGDGLTDADEVLLIDSNPCFADTDGDGAPDPTDSAPRDPTIQ